MPHDLERIVKLHVSITRTQRENHAEAQRIRAACRDAVKAFAEALKTEIAFPTRPAAAGEDIGYAEIDEELAQWLEPDRPAQETKP